MNLFKGKWNVEDQMLELKFRCIESVTSQRNASIMSGQLVTGVTGSDDPLPQVLGDKGAPFYMSVLSLSTEQFQRPLHRVGAP